MVTANASMVCSPRSRAAIPDATRSAPGRLWSFSKFNVVTLGSAHAAPRT